MGLAPIQSVDIDTLLDNESTQNAPVIPTRTYALDLETGEIGGIIDGEAAIRQFIRKTILTARFRFLIYTDDYGCELEDLIGQELPFELLQVEVPRVITEALTHDNRVSDVTNFDIKRDNDKLFISFTVVLTNGNEINEQVTV